MDPVQPCRAARLTRIGAPAPSTGPTYGMNRSAAPSVAQTNGYGTWRKYSPTKTAMPYSRLTRDCINSCRLTRLPASSNAFVVVASCPCPISPISRSRRSRRSSSMKMTIAATSPAVPSGPTTGPSHAKAEKPVAGLEVTTTGRDTVPFGASDVPGRS